MPNCQRCGAKTLASSMSRFNTEMCCMECLADEKLAPGYAAAAKAEEDQVRAGNYNFRGVGLSLEDRAFLVERRANRQ